MRTLRKEEEFLINSINFCHFIHCNSDSSVHSPVAVVVAFFICWAPFHAQRLVAIYLAQVFATGSALMHHIYSIVTYISGVLFYLSTCINPILYHLMSLKFRQAFKVGHHGFGGQRHVSLARDS